MKFKAFFLPAASGLFLAGAAMLFTGGVDNPLYQPRHDMFKLPQTGIRAAMERYHYMHLNVNTGKVETSDLVRSQYNVMEFVKKQRAMKTASGDNLQWIEMGPNDVGGRTRAILFDRNNSNRVYAGQVSGGLWISNNGGVSWNKWEPAGGLGFLNVSCIAQAINGDVYVGTGEALGTYSMGTESGNTSFIGSGIWKSTDGGNTFTQLPATVTTPTTSSGPWVSVQRLACHQTNSNIVYAATARGIQMSFNGGDSWINPVKNAICSDLNSQADDIKITSEGLIYAALGTTPYLSPDGDTARPFESISDNGSGYAQLNFSSAHNFQAGQRIYICGTGVPSQNRARQAILSVPNSNSVVLTSSYSVSGSGSASSWVPLISTSDSIYVIDNSSSMRIEFGVNSANPSYAYCAIAKNDRTLKSVLYSSNKGKYWFDLGVNIDMGGGAGGQADYDLFVGGYPDNPGVVIAGEVQMASNEFGAWDYHSITFDPTGDGTLYVHADKHTITFHPSFLSNQKIFYGTDGGMFMSQRTGNISFFQEMNRGYATTQFYGLAIGPNGEVFGGTQDNGNPFVDPNVISYGEPTPTSEDYNLPSGDGGYGEISVINPDAFVWESQGGEAARSPNRGDGDGSAFLVCSQLGGGAFVTPFLLWESFNDTTSSEFTTYITDSFESHAAGKSFWVKSGNNKKPFIYTTDTPVGPLDTLKIQDIVQAKFFVVVNGGVWMTKDILDFSATPNMQKISGSGTTGEARLAISKDGDHLFFSIGQTLYRLDGILGVANTTLCNSSLPPGVSQKTLEAFNLTINHITVDPQDANNVVVALGQYTSSSADHVFRTSDGLSANPAFVSIQGTGSYALPEMPVYSCLIEKDDKEIVIVGTEYGMYSTQNAYDPDPVNVRWTEENTGMSMVPVYQIRQQINTQYVPTVGLTGVKNEGTVYISTHGRGIFRCEKYTDPLAVAEVKILTPPVNFSLFPNPVSDYGVISWRLENKSQVLIEMYDINGKLIRTIINQKFEYGNYKTSFNACDLEPGSYFITVTAEGNRTAKRFMVIK
ncbi:MAG: T9SS type A sorting domain-containing protein [Bacteroidetes bacterium]|nr:T9SS type A sorting domain-containing protein [Bacteroidota bacterium]